MRKGVSLVLEMIGHMQRTMMPVSDIARSWAPALSIMVHTRARGISSSTVTRAQAPPQMPTDSVQTAHPRMFCYQCEQTKNGTGCDTVGVCGKTPEVAVLQDLLMYQLKGLSCWAHLARQHGVVDHEVDSFVLRAAFSTLTNVNFDDSAFFEYLKESQRLAVRMQSAAMQATSAPDWSWPLDAPHPALFAPMLKMDNPATVLATGQLTGILAVRQQVGNDTLVGLQELLVYGLKGLAAYAHHAERLGATDDGVYAFVHSAFTFLASDRAHDSSQLLSMLMECGRANYRVMQLLDEGHNARFGTPEPTEVRMTPVEGKCILVSGHDVHDLENLLRQTEGLGINVYTHGELLPAHSYPGLKRHKHLVGNYGGAWYRQKLEFAEFPGAVLMTTNCVLDPPDSYADNLFTTGETGVKASQHVPGPDFSAVIRRAQALPGFSKLDAAQPVRTHTVGFGHSAVLGVADKVLDAVATGQLRHIFLVGGCDGNEPQRKYYQRLHAEMPSDTLVLTLGCGKFRVLGQEWGTLGETGIPRLLDMGQCNDAYSAIVVATELAKALNTDINSLPLSLDISWFEQKAVAVLLTLLSLGVRDIRLGPKLPAFLTPDAIAMLQEKFNIQPADSSNPAEDVRRMMAKA